MQEYKRIEYLCLACGWRKSIPESWADSKPKKCPGKKCKTNFMTNPEKLASYDPENKSGTTSKQEEVKEQPKQERKYKKRQ